MHISNRGWGTEICSKLCVPFLNLTLEVILVKLKFRSGMQDGENLPNNKRITNSCYGLVKLGLYSTYLTWFIFHILYMKSNL